AGRAAGRRSPRRGDRGSCDGAPRPSHDDGGHRRGPRAPGVRRLSFGDAAPLVLGRRHGRGPGGRRHGLTHDPLHPRRGPTTVRVYPDARPLADGTIHIDFVSDDAFVNAIEVAPSKPGQPLPLRILAGRATYRYHAGNIWLPDRFFFGGRRTYRAEGLPAITD